MCSVDERERTDDDTHDFAGDGVPFIMVPPFKIAHSSMELRPPYPKRKTTQSPTEIYILPDRRKRQRQIPPKFTDMSENEESLSVNYRCPKGVGPSQLANNFEQELLRQVRDQYGLSRRHGQVMEARKVLRHGPSTKRTLTPKQILRPPKLKRIRHLPLGSLA